MRYRPQSTMPWSADFYSQCHTTGGFVVIFDELPRSSAFSTMIRLIPNCGYVKAVYSHLCEFQSHFMFLLP